MTNRINREEEHIRDMLALSERARRRYKEEQKHQQEEEINNKQKEKYKERYDPDPIDINIAPIRNTLSSVLNTFIDNRILDYTNMDYENIKLYPFNYSIHDKEKTFPFTWDIHKENELNTPAMKVKRPFSFQEIIDIIYQYKNTMCCFKYDADCQENRKMSNPMSIPTKEHVWNGYFYMLNYDTYIGIAYNIRKYRVMRQNVIKEEPVFRLITYFLLTYKQVEAFCGTKGMKKIDMFRFQEKSELRGDFYIMAYKHRPTPNVMKFLQENNIEYEQLFESYPPNVIAIIEYESIRTMDNLRKILLDYLDLNMMTLYEDKEWIPTHPDFKVNHENIEKYNHDNVIAFNASVDKYRKFWKDMPDGNDPDFKQKWPKFSLLTDMIDYGQDQGNIERLFPEVFRGSVIMPNEVKGKMYLEKMYCSPYMAHRKFYPGNAKGIRLSKQFQDRKILDFLNESCVE